MDLDIKLVVVSFLAVFTQTLVFPYLFAKRAHFSIL